MSKKKGNLRDIKSRKHTTVIEPAKDLVRMLQRCDEVTKIDFNWICSKGRRYKLVTAAVAAGVRMTVQGGGSRQYFFVKTCSPSEVERKILESWKKLH